VCGICGLAAVQQGPPISPSNLEAMCESLRHRGPDERGVHVSERIGLAMRRLSIIDLEHGQQPMANEAGDVLAIQNGEIYNFAALAERLRGAGHQFHTQSDTEVLPHLYEERGLDFARELRGMFAVAVWDQPRERLVLARDRYGIKPLLYCERDGALAFSSELTSLLESGLVERTVSRDALEQFLRFNWIPGEETIFAGVRSLPPGHMLIAESGEVRVERFAGPTSAEPRPSAAATATDESVEELLARLRDSVAAHLVADVPVGVLLSGGVDSAVLTALAAEEVGRPQTFSIGFEDPRFNELPRARLVAERFATDHHELIVDPDVVALMDRLVATFDQPLGDSSTVPSYLVCELAAQHVKVALSGEGGDELFGGYNTYAADLLGRWVGPAAALTEPLVRRIPDTSSRYPDRAKRFVRGAALDPVARHCSWLEVWSPEAIDQILPPRSAGAPKPNQLRVFEQRYATTAGSGWLTRLQDLDVGTYLVDDLLMKTDLASMAHSLEVRVPYLDPVVANFAYPLSPRLKISRLRKKWLLKQAAAQLVPKEILTAPKQGFSIPAARWLREDLREYATDVLSESTLRRQGFFEPEVVQGLYREHLARREDHSRRLWGVLTFTLWAEKFEARLG
jgi:asparagine synthase (glutamine-hydrolysing)